jgi:hypothetical protein
VQDVELGLLADVAEQHPEVLVGCMQGMAANDFRGGGFQYGNHLQVGGDTGSLMHSCC